jgi:hypothetical protein
VNVDEIEMQLRNRLEALGPAPRAELLHALMLPDFERAERSRDISGMRERKRIPSPSFELRQRHARVHRVRRKTFP